MTARHFDLTETVLTFAGNPITEFAEGDSVSIELDEDQWAAAQGHHGSVLRAKRNSNLGSATVTLMYGSPANEILQSIADQDQATGLGAGGFSWTDLNGSTTCTAAQAWITKVPPIKGSTEPTSNEWTFKLANPVLRHGQNRLV
jgi:hypothetical protein